VEILTKRDEDQEAGQARDLRDGVAVRKVRELGTLAQRSQQIAGEEPEPGEGKAREGPQEDAALERPRGLVASRPP
jgi:hypothetical protein